MADPNCRSLPTNVYDVMSDLTRPVPPRGTPKRARTVSDGSVQRAALDRQPARATPIADTDIQVVGTPAPGSRGRPRSKQERTVRSIVFALVALVSVMTVIMGFVWWRSNNLFSRINRQEFSDGALRGSGTRAPADPFNILLVGSDSRAEGDPVEGETSGVEGQRSDVMLMIRVVPGAKKAAFMSLPRDLYVKIADTGGMQRLNTAFNRGPENLVNTVTGDLGIPVDHYMQIDFAGFSNMIDTIGGVTVNFAYPAIDTYSGLDQPNPGCQRLDGEQALAFVRSRHYQYVQDGKMQSDRTADLGRIERQQYLLKAIAQAAIDQGATNPLKADALISSLVDYVTIDDTLSKADIFDLSRDLKDTGVENLVSFTLPTIGSSAQLGGQKASVLKLDSGATDVIAAFNTFGVEQAATTSSTVVDSSVTTAGAAPVSLEGATIAVLNGTTTSGLAAKAAEVLTTSGATVTRTGNGATNKLSVTEIRYGINDLSRAQAAASALGVTATLVSDAKVTSTDLVVTLGKDYIARSKATTAPAGAAAATNGPATTAVAATTSTTLPGEAPAVAPKGLSLEPCN